jgi:hypothetical protein
MHRKKEERDGILEKEDKEERDPTDLREDLRDKSTGAKEELSCRGEAACGKGAGSRLDQRGGL